MKPASNGDEHSAAEFLPARKTLRTLTEASRNCRGCPLYRNATQTVFGHGSAGADCMLIGEQPGDEEDKQGLPFVGPAGRILTKALDDVGIDHERVYTTNAVKHFKNEIRGKRRIHRSPNRAEIQACRPWLEEELRIVKPQVVVCLGVSAAQALLERKVTLRDERGRFFESQYSPHTFITTHPSSILRSVTSEDRHRNYDQFVGDLGIVFAELGDWKK